jgi:large subunit ribosomal protein L17
MLKNLASALILTEQDGELLDNAAKVKGRVITTEAKAKEVRPLVEKCITIARRGIAEAKRAEEFETSADRNSEAWKTWRQSPQWQQWAAARAPYVAARRQVLSLLGDKKAVGVLFETVAPRFADRPGGYTRILKLARPRLGDAGTRAVIEFVGNSRDRVAAKPQKPAFEGDAGASPN